MSRVNLKVLKFKISLIKTKKSGNTITARIAAK